MSRSTVYKYGPIDPDMPQLIKYGPPIPGPKEGLRGDKEVEAILGQISACLKEIGKILKKTDVGAIVDNLDLYIAQLNLLHRQLSHLQKKK